MRIIRMCRSVYRVLINKLITSFIRWQRVVELGENTTFIGLPLIMKNKMARIVIGDNTIINSSNDGYHINMFAKSKIYADRPYAIIEIGKNCRIHGTCIHAYNKISIGNNCLIAANTQIIDGNGHQLSMDDPSNRINTTDNGNPIIIEDNVRIASNVIILGGSLIGEGSIISAGSVIKGIVPSRSIYGGNPAKLLKQYN